MAAPLGSAREAVAEMMFVQCSLERKLGRRVLAEEALGMDSQRQEKVWVAAHACDVQQGTSP